MEVTIDIDETTCIRCGKCTQVCPSRILLQPQKGGAISLQNVESCIVCGHCAAVCPTGSVRHSSFPPEKIHAIDRSRLPTPEQLLLLCKARRSNRALSDKPVPEEMLRLILEAAHRAPTASNLQQVGFTLVTAPDKLRAVSEFTLTTFEGVRKKLENPLLKPILRPLLPDVYKMIPNFKRLCDEYARGNDLILRGATALILIHTPHSSRFGCQDANLAYQNGSLMAESLGVSQFYTGFVCAAVKQDKHGRLARKLGIEGRIQAGMALGMPRFFFPNYTDKKEAEITRG